MSEISEIRPTYPITPVRRREHKPDSQEEKQRPRSDKDRKPPADDDDGAPAHRIDEYV